MILIVARTRDKANTDRLKKFLKKAGSSHIKAAKEKDGTFIVKFTEPSPIESYLHHGKSNGRKALDAILRTLGSPRRILGVLVDDSPEGAALRAKVIAIARDEIPDFPRATTRST